VDYEVESSNPIGQSVRIHIVYRELSTDRREVDLPNGIAKDAILRIDKILGMDERSGHNAPVEYRPKEVTLRQSGSDEVVLYGVVNSLQNHISFLETRQLIH
jgi:hypothetical protein